jgi:hypothetical protein
MSGLDYTPFAPRNDNFHGIVEHAGHRLKGYSVRYGERAVDWEEHPEGIELALTALPNAKPARVVPAS